MECRKLMEFGPCLKGQKTTSLMSDGPGTRCIWKLRARSEGSYLLRRQSNTYQPQHPSMGHVVKTVLGRPRVFFLFISLVAEGYYYRY